jgi:ornithine cyclodeaminase/alanine dehydrogenase-like protein (mu-crystallin family)
MLILTHEEIVEIFSMDLCIQAIEEAYREFGQGRGITSNRTEMFSKRDPEDYARFGKLGPTYYMLRTTGGILPGKKIAALRINSHIECLPRKLPVAPGEKYVGLVLLFSIEDCQPLLLFPDGWVQRMRVGGTNALGAKYLAKGAARTMGLIGSGFQASALLTAMIQVRPVQTVKVFSPTKDHRKAFASRMEKETGIEVVAVDTVREAMQGSDIVGAATNSATSVFDLDSMEEGMHICITRRQEIAYEVVSRCDLLATNGDPETNQSPVISFGDDKDRPEPLQQKGWWSHPDVWERMVELGKDLIPGKTKRSSERQKTFFYSTGRGFQFAAVGAKLYEVAKQNNVGREVPPEWFLQPVPG